MLTSLLNGFGNDSILKACPPTVIKNKWEVILRATGIKPNQGKTHVGFTLAGHSALLCPLWGLESRPYLSVRAAWLGPSLSQVVQLLSQVWLFAIPWTARLPCPSPSPRVCSNSCPLSNPYLRTWVQSQLCYSPPCDLILWFLQASIFSTKLEVMLPGFRVALGIHPDAMCLAQRHFQSAQ